jgi:hypothetical protein
VGFLEVTETWTSGKDETELDGYRFVSKLRKRNHQVGGCSNGFGTFYKEKLYQRVQVLHNAETNAMQGYFES